MTPLFALAALMGVLGLAIGSFLNVVIYRVPAGLSVVSPASRCPRCEVPIKGRHNVPVLGWLVLRGRCASCALPISVRYPLVEFATGALFVAITLHFGLTAPLPAFLYLAAMGVTLAMIYVDTRWLPDAILLPSYVVAVLLFLPATAVDGEWNHAWHALVGMAALAGIVASLALVRRGLGLAEVQLAGLLGLSLGWLSWQTLFVAAVLSLAALGIADLLTTLSRLPGVAGLAIAPLLLGSAALALFATSPAAALYSSIVPS